METNIDRKDIPALIETFDFDRAQDIMRLLDWKWLGPKNKSAVPTIWQMKRCAHRLLHHAFDAIEYEPQAEIGSGGFTARIGWEGDVSFYFTALKTNDYELDYD